MTDHWTFVSLLTLNILLVLALSTTPAMAGEEACAPCYSGSSPNHQGLLYHATYPHTWMDEEHPGVNNLHGEEIVGGCFDGLGDFHGCCEPGGVD